MIFASIQTWDGRWKAVTAEQYARLRAEVPQLPEEKPDWLPGDGYWLSPEAFELLAEFNLTVEPKRGPNAGGSMLVKLAKKIEQLTGEGVRRGDAVTIAIPDLGLMTVKYVKVLEDCCTDVLQDHLDKGWRLLAVCPPCSQRRPDYVLGRSDKPC